MLTTRCAPPLMAVSQQPDYVTAAQKKLLKREAPWKPGEVAPSYLDGTLAGDNGFDPMFLAVLGRKSLPALVTGEIPLSKAEREKLMLAMPADEAKKQVEWLAESEIKHARLAMLATAGWPLAELMNPWSLGATGGRAPSLFNGGLGDGIIAPFLFLATAAAAYLEVQSKDAQKPPEYVPGALGFDPFGFCTEEGAYKRRAMREAELLNGRLAMLAITGFAVQEFLYQQPVVKQTPFFFGL